VYTIEYTNRFKKDLKRCNKRGYNLDELIKVIDILQRTGELPAMYKPHLLKGKYSGLWECHIKPDWLLIWHQDNSSLTLLMMNTGTHSDLF
jgi:mRNA interferase YafQ